jgi:hypothetical protein
LPLEADETHESDSRKPSGAADPSGKGEAFRVAALPPAEAPGAAVRLGRVLGFSGACFVQDGACSRMSNTIQAGPSQAERAGPSDKRAKWLLFVIAILLGLIASQISKRLI